MTPLVGCHVSIAGGLWNAPKNAADFGCETFQIFTRSPQGGSVPPITPEIVEKFKAAMEQYKLETFVIHTPYFINFGSGTDRIYHGSISVVRQELDRGTMIGAKFLMCHLGSFKDTGTEKGMKQVKKGLTEVLKTYKGTTQLLIEISAGAGEVIGDTFDELGAIIDFVKDYEGFGGICFDTQHAFGSGYDLRTPESAAKVFKEFDKCIGLNYLRMSHVNDSKVELGAKKDRHDHIGDGLLGKEGIGSFVGQLDANKKKLVYDKKEKKSVFPLILETEHDKVEADIKTLKALRNKFF
jgi:deoxyribonuclease-4